MANRLFQAFIDTAKTIAGYPITVANAVFMRDGSTLDEFSENTKAKIGTTDISKYSDGTVTGAIKSACDKANVNEVAIADVNSNLSKVGVPDYAHARLLDNTLSNITFEFTAPSNGFVTACGYGENQSTSYIQFIYNQNQNIRKAVQGVSDESISAQMTLSKGDTITINTCLSKRNSGTYFVPYKE